MNQEYDPKNNSSISSGQEIAGDLSLASAGFGNSAGLEVANQIVQDGAIEGVTEPRITVSAFGMARANDNSPETDEVFSSQANIKIYAGPEIDPEPQAETISLNNLPHSSGHNETVWTDGVKTTVEGPLRAVTSGGSARGTERVSIAA